MKLSDVVGNSGLAFYAEVALILFVLAFVVIVVRLFVGRRAAMEDLGRLPLDDAPARSGEERS